MRLILLRGLLRRRLLVLLLPRLALRSWLGLRRLLVLLELLALLSLLLLHALRLRDTSLHDPLLLLRQRHALVLSNGVHELLRQTVGHVGADLSRLLSVHGQVHLLWRPLRLRLLRLLRLRRLRRLLGRLLLLRQLLR